MVILTKINWNNIFGVGTIGLILRPLITHRFSLDKYQEAFRLMYERREMYCKVMFVM